MNAHHLERYKEITINTSFHTYIKSQIFLQLFPMIRGHDDTFLNRMEQYSL